MTTLSYRGMATSCQTERVHYRVVVRNRNRPRYGWEPVFPGLVSLPLEWREEEPGVRRPSA